MHPEHQLFGKILTERKLVTDEQLISVSNCRRLKSTADDNDGRWAISWSKSVTLPVRNLTKRCPNNASGSKS